MAAACASLVAAVLGLQQSALTVWSCKSSHVHFQTAQIRGPFLDIVAAAATLTCSGGAALAAAAATTTTRCFPSSPLLRRPCFSASQAPCSSHSSSATEDYLSLSDKELAAQCEVDTFRASGPGGQHRNKTES
eukprot:c29014_g1_i2 orf=439-837(+)